MSWKLKLLNQVEEKVKNFGGRCWRWINLIDSKHFIISKLSRLLNKVIVITYVEVK